MTDYVKYLEDTNAPIWAKRDVERLLGQFSTDATVDQNGIVRWKKSGRVPPEDILSLWAHVGKPFNLVSSNETREAETNLFLADYRERMQDVLPSAEEMFEMRSAFGEGAEVVNIITGKSTKL
jgi:hypothetical protein